MLCYTRHLNDFENNFFSLFKTAQTSYEIELSKALSYKTKENSRRGPACYKGQMQRNLDNFSFVENPFLKHTNRKQNRLSKFGFAQNVVLKIRKSDGFREL